MASTSDLAAGKVRSVRQKVRKPFGPASTLITLSIAAARSASPQPFGFDGAIFIASVFRHDKVSSARYISRRSFRIDRLNSSNGISGLNGAPFSPAASIDKNLL